MVMDAQPSEVVSMLINHMKEIEYDQLFPFT